MSNTTLYNIIVSDCLDAMRSMGDNTYDSIVTDPPYGLSFMGKDWDHGVPGSVYWAEALRVAKPGAYLLAFGGTRTYHRLACAVEDAGWEIRDCMMWLYGSGFPKSLDVSKAIDKAAGAPVTPEAEKWNGWGTALKPAWEPVLVARKPLIGTVAENVLTYGTGAINIDASRIPTRDDLSVHSRSAQAAQSKGIYGDSAAQETHRKTGQALGRWPANLILDEEAAAMFEQSRFFYCAKSCRSERGVGNDHPTVKPLGLMEYLVRLVTRRGGHVLDPFAGSGSTLVAAVRHGYRCTAVEREQKYADIITMRIKEEQK